MERVISEPLKFNKVTAGVSRDKFFHNCCWLWLFAFFVLPDAFGFRFLFLFSAKRIMMFICYAQILSNKDKYNKFWHAMKSVKYFNIFIILYMFVRLYTAVFRLDINTFAGEFLDGIMVFYLFIYVLREEIEISSLLKFIYGVFLFLSIHSFIEYFTGFNILSYLDTVGGDLSIATGVRLGLNRVTANCHHPIHFGIYMTILFFLSCIDYKNNKLDLFYHKGAFFLALFAIYSSGSRGPLGIFLGMFIVILLFSNKDQRILGLLILTFSIIIIAGITFVNLGNAIGRNIMRMLTASIDGIFGTTYSYQYGGERYIDSTLYREALSKVFKVSYFNKFIGRGISYELSVVIDGYWLRSCDNSYVYYYIATAYPGLITFCLLFAVIIVVSTVLYVKTKYKIYILFAITIINYMINIRYVALMGTLMYMWMIFAMFFAVKYKLKRKKEGEEKCNLNLLKKTL